MKPLRGVPWAGALLLVAAGARPVHGAWNNVFQVCCSSCGQQQAVSSYTSGYAAEAGCSSCPQQCTTQYVQRCYYQPVTTYQTKSYYEQVTSYHTSYYYEPVTSYRYSCYYDPCSCSYKQVACPTTSYQLRSQCCPVQNWVQRCCQVPVTSYQQAFYYEPVTSCCTPPAPACCPTSYNAPAYQAPAVQQQAQAGCATPAPATPGVSEQSTPATPGAPGVREYPAREGSGSQSYERQYPVPQTPSNSPTGNSVYRQEPPRLPVNPPPTASPLPPPKVRLDRIVTGPVSQVQGQVVRNDNTPRPGARLMFVRAALEGGQQSVTADAAGQFHVTLASGGWLVYVPGTDDRPVFHSKLEVRDNETRQITLVSR